MNATLLLAGAIFLISLVLTMVGLGGGLIFSPLFVLFGFAKSEAASASLFLNLIAAASAAFTCARKKMVDFSLAVPLIVSSSLTAPLGSYLNMRIDLKPFLIIMAAVLALAGARMLLSPGEPGETDGMAPSKKIAGGVAIGACIGLMGGLLGIGGGVFVVAAGSRAKPSALFSASFCSSSAPSWCTDHFPDKWIKPLNTRKTRKKLKILDGLSR